MSITLLALFNLKDGISEKDYLEWAKRVDIPTVNGLRSIDNFQVYSVQSIFGSEEKPPYQYYEIIKVNHMDDFLEDIGSKTMQDVAAEFKKFTDDVFFLLSDEIV